MADPRTAFVTLEVISSPMIQGAVPVGITPVEAKVGATALPNRVALRLFNKGPQTVWMGPTTAVTPGTGEPLFKDQMTSFPVGSSSPVYLVANAATQSVVVWEASE